MDTTVLYSQLIFIYWVRRTIMTLLILNFLMHGGKQLNSIED